MKLNCTRCKEEKDYTEFDKNKSSKTGFHNECKICRKRENKRKLEHYYANKEKYDNNAKNWKLENREKWNEYCANYRKAGKFTYKTPLNRFHRAKRRANELKATPMWSDLNKIKEIYNLASELNKKYTCKFEVDHIHPLLGETLSGLHVWFNLMILPRSINRSKGNKLMENIKFPRVSDNFENYLSELKMYAELVGNELQDLENKKSLG